MQAVSKRSHEDLKRFTSKNNLLALLLQTLKKKLSVWKAPPPPKKRKKQQQDPYGQTSQGFFESCGVMTRMCSLSTDFGERCGWWWRHCLGPGLKSRSCFKKDDLPCLTQLFWPSQETKKASSTLNQKVRVASLCLRIRNQTQLNPS